MRLKLIYLLFFLAAVNQTQALEQHIRFDLLSIKNGLSQSSVNAVLQDNEGFIWIGTQDGLNRYDGYNFTAFYHLPEDSSSVCDNFIRALSLDSLGNIWVGTDFGLSVFNPATEKFKSYYHSPKDEESPSGDAIRGMDFDNSGMLWVATARNGLYQFNPTTEKAQRYKSDGAVENLQTDNLHSVMVDSKNTVWIGTDGEGLKYFERKTKKFQSSVEKKEGNIVWTIYEDNAGIIWAGTNKGLFNYDSQKSNEVQFREVFLPANDVVIKTICQAIDKTIWVGSEASGLFNIQRVNSAQQSKTKHYVYNPQIPDGLCDDMVLSIFEDRTGLLWLGTNNGLNKFDPKKQSFGHLTSVPGTTFNLLDNTVWSILDDGKYLWIGSRLGLNQIDKQTGVTVGYSDISNTSYFRNNRSVLQVFQRRNGDVFIGTTDGLYLLEIGNSEQVKRFVPVNYNDYFFKKTEENKIYKITEDSHGNIWLGTKKGLAKISADLKTSVYFTEDKSQLNSLPNNTVREIFEDHSGRIWVGTEGGLSVVYEENGQTKFKTYTHTNAEGSISNDLVMSIWQDKANRLWMGTYGGGLNLFDHKTEKFIAYKEKDGLSNNVVYGVLGDSGGSLWLTTNKGVSVFNPTTETFIVYHENDGLQSDEFNIGAHHINKEGIIYFGGINGVSFFHPNDVKKNLFPPQMAFTNFKINNKSVAIGSREFYPVNLNHISDMTLSYKVNNFTFEFAALHYSFPEKNQYFYKMVGFDEDWINIGTQRYAHYTNLSPGEYTLIIKGRNSDGVESDNVASLNLTIMPPFWFTWWFWVLTSITLIGATMLGIRIRIGQIKAQKVALEITVKERTLEVTQQKEQIEAQKNAIQLEKEKSEKLLLNILPEQMVDELKMEGKAKARNYRRVTVMFTDFKGFTKISETMNPTELVEQLDSYFIKFDEIIARNNVEKIKTIGDAYMCAGGLPIRNKSNPIEVVLAALEIQRYMADLKEVRKAKGEEFWELRIGVHTGDLIAGVIGIKRFAYDIWGDTVNVANRMEMSGEVGKVNVSGKTYSFVKNFFNCTYRGKILAKNKGEIDMYYVDRIKPELSINREGKIPNDIFWDYVDLELYSSINYKKAEKFIIKTLEEGLSKDLHYHNIEHMKDVCASVERIAKGEGIKGEDVFLLKTAALYHDGGFVEQYTNNEPIGARMAKEALPVYGYSDEQLDVVEQLILATKVPQQPSNHLEEIICDADLDYLGRDDFYPISEGLKKEFMAYGIVKNNKHWDEIQIKFLSAHRYFTKTNITTREAKKQERLAEIKTRFQDNNYQ